ncbi:hypothetical protein JHK87_039322 [Glycine soja]|nr:hypothetical protein JHK87_039322 [Glycine soja]
MSFKNSPKIQHKGASPCLSRQSSTSSFRAKPQKNVEPPSPLPVGCCRGFSNAKTMGSSASTSHQNMHQLQYQKLELKVADLEKEVQKQTELGVMYRKRMERTQDYLRYCLQIAQANGILDLIVNCKGEFQQSPVSVPTISSITSPQIHIPTPPNHGHHPNLAAIIDQAKINGWYIDPNEIQLEEKIGQGSTAEIHRGTWRGFEVAVKCISEDFFRTNQNGVAYFSQELETLSRQRHRFVLHLMGACIHPPRRAWVVTEHLSTTLKEWLHGPGTRRRERMVPLPPFKDRVIRALEIAQAMHFGIILNELLTGNYPYVETEYGPTKIAMEVVEGKLRPKLPCDDVGQLGELIDLICLCWDKNPSTRPSFATITLCLKSYVKKNLL